VGFKPDEIRAGNSLEAGALPVNCLHTSLEAIVKLPLASATGQHLSLDHKSVGACISDP